GQRADHRIAACLLAIVGFHAPEGDDEARLHAEPRLDLGEHQPVLVQHLAAEGDALSLKTLARYWSRVRVNSGWWRSLSSTCGIGWSRRKAASTVRWLTPSARAWRPISPSQPAKSAARAAPLPASSRRAGRPSKVRKLCSGLIVTAACAALAPDIPAVPLPS